MAKRLVGTVTSDAQDKTIVVTVTRRVTHPIYGKQYTVSKRIAAHDETNQASKGDIVELVETRPISKHKSFKLNRVIEKSHGKIELKQEAVEKESAATEAKEAET